MQGIVDKCLRISKTLMRRISGGGENVLKVNVYIETDNGSKKKLYRGYGAVVEFLKRDGKPEIRKVSGMCYGNWNLAYIQALTEALDLLIKPCIVTMFANNDYVCGNIYNGRVNEWRLNGWHTALGEPIANTDEWRDLCRVSSGHQFHFVHIREKSVYSKEIQAEIKEIRDRGRYWQQMQLS